MIANQNWARVKQLFNAALELDPDQRRGFLAEACADDETLLEEVRSLLASDDSESAFLETPAYEGSFAPEAEAHSLAGHLVGPYKIIGEIGRGGMGAVYLAERVDEHFAKRVAIKLIKRGMDTDIVLQRFRNERQILANLGHPNIARLLDGGTTADGSPYFIMEHVEGQPIDLYADSHQLTISERLKLFRTVCSAVQFAHQNLVIHRDIKPSNILITKDGEPKLLDCGIAKLLQADSEEEAELTATAMRVMTTEFASPEQIRGDRITTSSDIYSLGVLLYELLTGHRPYKLKRHTTDEITRALCEQEPEKPSLAVTRGQGGAKTQGKPNPPSGIRNPKLLRGDLDNIILKALRKEPQRRYASVEHFSEDIRRHLEGLPVSARKDTVAYRCVKFTKRNKTAVASASVVALIFLIVGTSLSLLIGKHNPGASGTASDDPIVSIAVLPFVNDSSDPDAEYLSDGITESIINNISQLPDLLVIARNSVFRYKGREIAPQIVGRELGVRAVLSGRIAQHGETLSISTELVDANSNHQLWDELYNYKLSNLPNAPSEISQNVTEKLRLKISEQYEKRVSKHYTENPEAFQSYLKGRYHWNKRTKEDIEKSIEYFNQSIAKDPADALAYAGLANSYNVLPVYGGIAPGEALPKAEAAATKALEIDDMLAEAHTALANVKENYDWDFAAAEAEYKRAIELNPNHATNHQWYAEFLSRMGRHEEAINEIKQALAIDPLSLIISSVFGSLLEEMRQLDPAIEQLQKTIAMDKNFASAHERLALTYLEKGMYEEAITEHQTAAIISGGESPEKAVQRAAALRAAFQKLGVNGYWRKQLQLTNEDLKQHYVPPFDIAEIYARLGKKDLALEWLEKGYRERDREMIYLKIYQPFDALHSAPRFIDLMRRMNLAQ